MSDHLKIVNNNATNSIPMLRAMVGIGILCAMLIVVTYEGTLPRIERLKAEALQEAIFQVVPGVKTTKSFAYSESNGFREATNQDKQDNLVYAGYNEDSEFIGLAIDASGQGYADIIRILYGYNPETQTIVGFYVLESKETPGLGDKIQKDDNFLSNFTEMSARLSTDLNALENKIETVKSGTKVNPWEIDGISGATISSRAIGEIIDKSSSYWIPKLYQHKNDFLIQRNE